MRVQPFTQSDNEAVLAFHKRSKNIFYLIAGAQTVFFIVFAVIAPSHVPYWQYILPAVLLADVAALYFLSKRWKGASKDLQEQLKVTGDFKIEKKTSDESSYSISIDAGEKRSITVRGSTYDSIREGDVLYFEFAKHSGYLLTMKSGHEVLEPANK